MHIRDMTDDDYSVVASVYEEAFRYSSGLLECYYKKYNEYLEFCRSQGYAFVLEDEGQICGVIIGYEKPDMHRGKVLYIEMIAILSSKRGRGFGKALIAAMEGRARENGLEEVALRTKCYMDAYMIYNHLGYIDSQDDQRYMTKYIGNKK